MVAGGKVGHEPSDQTAGASSELIELHLRFIREKLLIHCLNELPTEFAY